MKWLKKAKCTHLGLDVRLMIEFITKRGFHMTDRYQAQERMSNDRSLARMLRNLVYLVGLQLNVSTVNYYLNITPAHIAVKSTTPGPGHYKESLRISATGEYPVSTIPNAKVPSFKLPIK